MKICYFFPIFKNVDAKKFFKEFSKSEFYKNHPDKKIVFVCEKTDDKNLEYLKTLENITLNVFESEFSYNDAFKTCLKDFNGDILLLGDCALCEIDTVFELCLEEYKKGADIVHLSKKYTRAKGFFANIWTNCSRIFSSLVANQKDCGNILSLGLYSRDVVEIMQALPERACLLKNSNSLIGFSSKTIFIDGSSETYSPNFHQKSSAIKSAVVCNIIFDVALVLMILFDILFPTHQLVITLVSIFFMIVSLAVCLMMVCKHFFDLRNVGKSISFSTNHFEEKNSTKSTNKSRKIYNNNSSSKSVKKQEKDKLANKKNTENKKTTKSSIKNSKNASSNEKL